MRKSVTTGLMAGVLGLGLANAEIKVSDALSLSGFIDMSAGAVLPDGGASSMYAGLDQFELDFMYTFSEKLSAQADLNYEAWNGSAVSLEQAFLTYAATESFALYAGKFLSSTGFEAAEPTGLYQYSYSKTLVYGGYQNGVAASYAVSPMISLYGAFIGSVWSGTDTDIKKPGYEAQISLMPIEGLTAKVAYAAEMDYAEDDGGDTGTTVTTDQSLVNAWVSYATGPVTVAAEFNYLMDWGIADDTGIGYLAMVNYALTDKLGVTGRYSAIKMDGGTLDNEVTVSPGYAISDAWFALAEAKYELEAKAWNFAVESLISF